MATVRVSSLPEIKVDRITDDDYYIVNDGDITTSKVAFKQMILGIAERDIEFQGDITFTGDVVMSGNIEGDFYTKSETYSKLQIDALVSELENYDEMQDDKILPLIKLSGEIEGSEVYRDFPKGIIQSQATTRSALTDLEFYADDSRTLIENLQLAAGDLGDELGAIDERVSDIEVILHGTNNDGLISDVSLLTFRVQTNESDIAELKQRVTISEGDISQLQLDLITLNNLTQDHDQKLDSLITLSGRPTNSKDLGAFTGSTIGINSTVKEALQDLETEVELKAPIDNPVFTTIITAPKAQNSVPCFYTGVSTLPSGGSYVEGVFAYADAEGSAYVSTTGGWERIISYNDSSTTPNRTALFNMLGYTVAYDSESAAAAGGVPIGGTYVYSATSTLSDGVIRANMATAP